MMCHKHKHLLLSGKCLSHIFYPFYELSCNNPTTAFTDEDNSMRFDETEARL